MPLTPAKPIQQQKIPAGTILFEPGKQADMLCILHQGRVGAYSKFDPESKTILYTMENNSYPGFAALVKGDSHLTGFKSLTECVISAFPAKGPFTKLIMGKLNVGLMASRSLAQEVIGSYQSAQKLISLLAELEKTQDNLGIAYSRCNPQQYQPRDNVSGGVIDPVITRARVTLAAFTENKGEIPRQINAAWLNADHRSVLAKNYEYISAFDSEEFQFLRSLLALPGNIQGAMYKANIKILEGLSRKLAAIIAANQHEIYQIQELINEAMENLLQGEYSFAEKFWLTADTLDSGFSDIPLPEFSQIVQFFCDRSDLLQKQYQSILLRPFKDAGPSLGKLRGFLASNEQVQEMQQTAAKTTTVSSDHDAIMKELDGSLGKIMSFLKLPAEDHKNLNQLLRNLDAESSPLDSSGEPRKLRKAIEQIYWKVYEAAWFKFTESKGNVPRYVQMMLEFGFLDEKMLDPEHLVFLYQCIDNSSSQYPIVSTLEWLDKIRDNAEAPSVDPMGQTYFQLLKQDFRDKGWKKESEVPPDINTMQRRVQSEIKNLVSENVRLTSGTPTTAFAILTRHQISIPLERCVVTNERLAQVLDQLLNVDYSAFHREVILNDTERDIIKEFVQIQVFPWFIRMPSIGSKMMMWQELSTRDKKSMGRVTLPVFATEDLYKMLLDAVAAFRWELTKTIMGADWNNVAQSSITADYTDYVQFYRKNRDLSKEQKEKLQGEFKRFRDDRSRFSNDYINWIQFEAEGVLKLNKVCRNIMYKHVPFHKKIRDEIASQPAYAEIHNRFKNIRNRKLRELETKYRKYEEKGLPPELQSTIDFYTV
ncbi:MAG: cyclic nucleotide-binding domain-containing protein [Leptospiraceae bacterium]|nr:cyclic nucleotide-binding domain-containing protein [Leptospiraceae bacterium]